MNYTTLKTKVYVCFYPALVNRICYQIISLTNINHCTILFERDDKRSVLAYGKSGEVKIVSAENYHSFHQPSHVIELGECSVSIQQFRDFIQGKRINDMVGILFWWWFGRLVIPRLVPRTCGTLTCDLIKLCGFKIKEHASPKALYKELTNATNNYCWSGRSWQDYISKADS